MQLDELTDEKLFRHCKSLSDRYKFEEEKFISLFAFRSKNRVNNIFLRNQLKKSLIGGSLISDYYLKGRGYPYIHIKMVNLRYNYEKCDHLKYLNSGYNVTSTNDLNFIKGRIIEDIKNGKDYSLPHIVSRLQSLNERLKALDEILEQIDNMINTLQIKSDFDKLEEKLKKQHEFEEYQKSLETDLSHILGNMSMDNPEQFTQIVQQLS